LKFVGDAHKKILNLKLSIAMHNGLKKMHVSGKNMK
jgi:hypothetical protein